MKQIVLTQRKDQYGYKPGDGTDPNKVIGGVRGYSTMGDLKRAKKQLSKRGFNNFTVFKDVQSDNALMYGRSELKHLK